MGVAFINWQRLGQKYVSSGRTWSLQDKILMLGCLFKPPFPLLLYFVEDTRLLAIASCGIAFYSVLKGYSFSTPSFSLPLFLVQIPLFCNCFYLTHKIRHTPLIFEFGSSLFQSYRAKLSEGSETALEAEALCAFVQQFTGIDYNKVRRF